MNYQMLKTLLDSLVLNFKCPNCSSQINETNLEIVWAAGSSVNLDIICNNCEKHTFVKAEVSQINLWNVIDIQPENIEEFKQKLHQKLTSINIKKTNPTHVKNIEAKIDEKQIWELKKVLKNDGMKVEDFFN